MRGAEKTTAANGAGRAAAATLYFVLALALALVYLNRVAPNTRSPWHEQIFAQARQIEAAALEGEPYLIVFGSSLTAYNLIPKAFEAELGERGMETRLFKVAMLGAAGHELNYYFRRVIRHLDSSGAPMPEFVLIDTVLPYSGFVGERGPGTVRLAEWHSLRETRNALETLAVQPGRPKQKFEAAMIHLGNLIRHYVPVGRFQAMRGKKTMTVSEARREPSPHEIQGAPEPEDRTALDDPVVAAGMAGGLSREEAERFARLRRQKLREVGAPVSLAERNTAVVRRQIEFLLERDVIPVYFVPPGFGDPSLFHELARREALPYVAAFDDPAAHPDLWRPEERRDVAHLKAGEPSERFSRNLAEAMHAHVFSRKKEYEERLRISVRDWDF